MARILSLLIFFAFVSGCNLWGGLESPSKRDELLLDAKLKMDAGKCGDALEIYNKITDPDDDVYYPKGWAQLCNSGAPFFKVGATILKYDPNAASALSIFGTLANSLVPQTAAGITAIDGAIATFNSIKSESKKKYSLALAYFVKAAALMAKHNTSGKVLATNISDNVGAGTCGAATCMDNTDATDFYNSIVAASNQLGGIADIGKLTELRAQLALIGAANNATRMFITDNMIAP